ncbi:MAG: hypothetical protein AUI47_05700 [Acidobacteria bacterium 13_1_40CM_2_68_5]|nr:MAG: hypothetical protein AUI47_05700 [Acidobacteria bacterium 13_1_40CM_2_68_5]
MTEGRAGSRLSDHADRRRAVTEFDRNLVVEAGAGTGKTALLVERALNLIAGAGTPIDRVAAITFTEKAAAELRERLARGLDELQALARDDARPALPAHTEARRSYAWLRDERQIAPQTIAGRSLGALLDLDFAPVSTLHAFCSDILRRYPREAGVEPDFRVDEGPSFQTLFAEEWDAFLAGELGPDAGRPALWRRALALEGSLNMVRDLGAALASFRLPWDAGSERAYGPAPPGALFGTEIAALRDRIATLRGHCSGMTRNFEVFLDLTALYLEAFLDRGPRGMALVEGDWTLDDYLRKKVPLPGRNLTGVSAEEALEVAGRAQDLVTAFTRVDEEIIGTVVEAAAPLARRARERLLAEGFVSFDALLRLTRDLLASHPPVRRELGARHRAILVDEFQDTDPLQYEILLFLAEEEGPPTKDAYEARLASGRLFIVGDPKQSIYRFRGADIEAYRRAVGRIVDCGGELLTLNNSFRSPSEIVAPINVLFEAFIGRDTTNEQPAYDPIVSARGPAGRGLPLVEIWSVAAAGNVQERRRAEGDAIAAWIAGNLDRTEATGEPLRCRHVALLFRALTSVDVYAQSLRRAGLPFVVDGGKDFYERPEVGDLIAFLKSAANPNDGAALLAVLRGPLGAVPDAELASFAASGSRLDLVASREVDGDRFPGVRRTLELVDSFRAGMPGRSPDEIIRSVQRETSLLVLHASLFEGAQRVANLRKMMAKAEDLGRRGLSLEETLRALEAEFQETRVEGESPLADETVDAVRILSAHKAKGLEFPVVIVPDVGRDPRGGGRPATEATWVRRDAAGFLAVCLPDGTGNVAWAWHAQSARRHQQAEEKRVLYVACTRARQRLILVNSNEGRGAPWRDALAHLGYSIEDGFPADGPLAGGLVAHRLVRPEAARAGAPTATIDGGWAEAARVFERAATKTAGVQPPVRSPATVSGDDAGAAAVPDERLPVGARRANDLARETARLAGSAVHAALEAWDLRDPTALGDLGRRALQHLLAGEGEGAPGELRARAEQEIRGILDDMLRSPLPARLVSLDIIGREVPLIVRDERGLIWAGACDLVYREGPGRLVLADYKTERLAGDPAAAAERHRPQMAIYLEAFRRALPGTSLRGEIIFVRSGVSVAI